MRSKFQVFVSFISLLLHVAHSLPTVHANFNVCQEKNGNFPKPGSSCKSYYKCENWMVLEIVCPEDQHFFPAKGYCVWPEEYPCREIPKSKECPLPDGKFTKEGTRCKIYYDCHMGVPVEKKCNGDLLFDQDKEHCEYPEFVDCPETLNRTTITISLSTSTTISTFDGTSTKENIITATTSPIISTNSLNIDSDENSSEEENSSEDDSSSKEDNQSSSTAAENKPTTTSISTHFKYTPSTQSRTKPVTKVVSTDIYTKKGGYTDDCIFNKFTYSKVISYKSTPPTRPHGNKDSVSTTVNLVKTDSVTLTIFCPEPNGYFPHPNNRHKFIACIQDIPTIMDCPANLVYDHRRRSCEYDKTRF